MNKTVIIGGVVVIGIGGLIFFAGGVDAPTVEEVSEPGLNNTKVTSLVSEDGSYTGSLEELAFEGGDWKCTITLTTEGITSVSTTYLSGDNMRSDVVSDVPMVGPMTMSAIVDEDYAYTWSSMQPGGYKIAVIDEESEEEVVDSEMEEVENIEIPEYLDYKCEKWEVDTTVFQLPKIDFQEITE